MDHPSGRTASVITLIALFAYSACAAVMVQHHNVRQSRRTYNMFGTYSHFDQTPDHVYGRMLELWRANDGTLEGRWIRANGEPADFPTALLTDITHNDQTGELRFTARWCDHIDHFEGIRTTTEVHGTLHQMPTTANNIPTHDEPLTLSRQRNDGPIDKSEWDIQTKALVTRVGPTCR